MTKRIQAKVEECIAIASKFYNQNFEVPSIQYTLRGTTAGRAKYDTNEVNFNLAIYKENGDAFLNRTVPHEVAHRISVMVYGKEKGRGHGFFWKYVMQFVFNLEPSRTHSYEVGHLKTRTVKRWKYTCGCVDWIHKLTTIKHNRILKKPRAYVCKHCRSTLRFIGEE